MVGIDDISSKLIPQTRFLAIGRENLSKDVLKLVYHPLAAQIIPTIPGQVIYQTILDVGKQDSLELISLLSPEQKQDIADLDCWNKDEFLSENFLSWLELYLEIGPKYLIKALKDLDYEQVSLFFCSIMTVYIEADFEDPDKNFHPDEDKCFLTHDRRYQIEVITDKEEELSFIKKMVNVLYQEDFDYTVKFLDEVRFALKSSLEELSYRFKDARTSEKGFSPFYEATKIFSPVKPDKLKTQLTKNFQTIKSQKVVPGTSLKVHEGPIKNFFLMALRDEQISDNKFLEIQNDFLALVNTVASAKQISPADVKNIQMESNFAQNMVSLSLDYLITDDKSQQKHFDLLSTFVKSVHPLELFKLGYSLIYNNKKKFVQFIKKADIFAEGQLNLLLTEEEYQLFERVSQIDQISNSKPSNYYEKEMLFQPESLHELNTIFKDQIIFYIYEQWFTNVLKIQKISADSSFQSGLLHRLFSTSVLNYQVSGKFSVNPIDRQDLKTIIDNMVESNDSGGEVVKSFSQDHKEYFKNIIKETIEPDQIIARFSELLDKCFDDKLKVLEEELNFFPEDLSELVPKYITNFFLV